MGTVSYPADGSQYSLTSCTPGTVQLNQSRPVPHLLPVPGEGQRHGGACPGVCVCVCVWGRSSEAAGLWMLGIVAGAYLPLLSDRVIGRGRHTHHFRWNGCHHRVPRLSVTGLQGTRRMGRPGWAYNLPSSITQLALGTRAEVGTMEANP